MICGLVLISIFLKININIILEFNFVSFRQEIVNGGAQTSCLNVPSLTREWKFIFFDPNFKIEFSEPFYN